MTLTTAENSPIASIHVETKYVPSPESSLPALVLQVTQLVGSYMLWVGTTEESAEDIQKAPLQGSLAKDWACAMPTKVATPAASTSLFRSSSSDVALSMAQRLARRFQKQIFLSIDVPPSFLTLGQGSQLLMAAEKAVVAILVEMENTLIVA